MSATKGTILLTGANGGLGIAIAQAIATTLPEVGVRHALYTVRSTVAADTVRSALAATKTHPHDILLLDLSKPSSVRETAAAINNRVSTGAIPRIRALILNAGYREIGSQTWTEDGLDTAFASNYLGHWLLTLLLLQSMDWESGRIVVVGGMVHDPQDKGNKINKAFEEEPWKHVLADASSESVESIAKGTWAASPDDPAQDPRELYGIRRYGAAKLFQIMMIPELQRRLDSEPNLNKISVLGVDPGMMPTTITVGTLNWLVRFIFSVVARVANVLSPNGFLRLPRKSAGDVLAAAFETTLPIGKQPKGLYLNGNTPKEMSDEAKDTEKRITVWRASLQYAKLREGETCLTDWQ
ncbi:putative short-chain dehydrogenase [Ophiobolus disseminans]|uniref:3beta-hydroxysteroid 3-dehydrogenase n=1 Tax=Ophiobolus disseminans TaxID=1469910 RepID=A0A6A7A730_9PLEO|nr:putative short-chain dehydrogenase [Ophiobolus disseminans]